MRLGSWGGLASTAVLRLSGEAWEEAWEDPTEASEDSREQARKDSKKKSREARVDSKVPLPNHYLARSTYSLFFFAALRLSHAAPKGALKLEPGSSW